MAQQKTASKNAGSGGMKPLEIKIDQGIPVPARRGGREIYGSTFRSMKVGDSFFLPVDVKRLSVTTGHWRKKLTEEYGSPVKFTVRPSKEKQGNQEIEGARVWRVEPEEEVTTVRR